MSGGGGPATPMPAELAALLATFPAGRELLARADGVAHALAGGTENRAWRVVANDVDWVVRAAGARDARLAVDRMRELAAARLAAAHGFAPAVVHAAPERGLLVTRHLAGRGWSREDARSAAGIERFGARLRALHAVPVPPDLRTVEPRVQIDAYLATDPPADAPVARDRLGALADHALARLAPAAQALCHHDLHHRNVIDSGALVFVDWEYAGRGEPLLDLAAFAAYHDFDAARRAALLAAYACADGETRARAQAARLDAALLAFDCLQALWYDAADAWRTLAADARAALVARLARAG